MDLHLHGKRALITGSSSGIGAAIAERLATEGATVVVHARSRDRAEVTAARIRDRGGRAEVAVADLAEPGSPTALVAEVLTGGSVDVLVANAGPFAEHRITDATDDDWTRAFSGVVLSAVGCARAVIPGMRRRGWGRVITLGTRAAVTPLPTMIEYSAAKAAVVNATGALAQELAGTGVTANVVSPGIILTPSLQTMFQDRARTVGDTRSWADLEPEVTADYAPNPVGRLGRPEDIAAAVAFLASPLADYITGTVLRVDGGITRTINP